MEHNEIPLMNSQLPSAIDSLAERIPANLDVVCYPTTDSQSSSLHEEPPAKKHCLDTTSSESDDGKLCPICLDSWTTAGEHRICALACGHIFGHSCITRWLNTQREKKCPTCKKKARSSDVRFLYATKLIPVDNSEVENMKKQLNHLSEEKNKMQIELSRSICREQTIKQRVEELQKNVEYLSKTLEAQQQFYVCRQRNVMPNGNPVVKLYLDKSLEICKESGCRVLDCFSRQDLIVASVKSPNALFPGYGVRTISISTYKPTGYIALHSKAIRDMKFNLGNPWLLSVSLDKTAKIVDSTTNLPICVYTSDTPLWSCCWDFNNPNFIYVGQQQGSVVKLDIRRMNDPVLVLDVPGDVSPVVSVASIETGVISCKLNSLWGFEIDNDEFKRFSLPIDGPFTSMTYENLTQQLLLSTRPNSNCPYSKHHLCCLETETINNFVCNTVHCIKGGSIQKYLSRSCFATYKSNHYIAAYEESNRCICLWDIKTGNKACSVSAQETVLDVCGVNISNCDLMASVTNRKIMFYKFQ